MLWAPIASAQARAFGSRIARRAVSEDDAEEITRKYGLEAGLFSVFKSKDTEGKGIKAKDLLAKYGSAYLITSISLSIVSFGLCYALINAGVDVGALLSKVRTCGSVAALSVVTAGRVHSMMSIITICGIWISCITYYC